MHLLIFWCYVTVWPIVGQHASSLVIIFPCYTLFILYNRDIFSVTKFTKALVIDQAACYYAVFSVIIRVEKYMNICHEFSSNLRRCCFCWVEGSAIFVPFNFGWLFLDAFVYSCCLMNRDIWWGVFELIFVPSAAY